MSEDNRNDRLAALATDALQMQNAGNLCGLAQSFAKVVLELRQLEPSLSTVDFNTHPIIGLWVSRLHELAYMGLSDMGAYARCDHWCKRISHKDPITLAGTVYWRTE